MKRCPECRRDYYDDTLLYCLDDGNALLEGPASGSFAKNEPPTAIFPDLISQTPSTEANTAVFRAVDDRSIAVLPFVNMSADADNEYFCDGLAEDLLNALAKISGLRVAARTSAFLFKGRDTNIIEIGRALNVRTVVEGSVRRSGDRMRINLQLVDAADGHHIWSERYDREIKDIFDLQDEITQSVASALKLKLLGETREAVLKRFTDDSEAYQEYLRGRYQWNRRTSESLRQAADFYRRAVEIDQQYALAYSALAETYVIYESYGLGSAEKSMPEAKAMALKALSIDESLPGAHAALGLYLSLYEWDRTASEREFRRAIELNPNYATAHHWLGHLLLLLRRFDEGILELRRAEKLDPLSPIISTNIADGHLYMGSFEEAIERYERVLELHPELRYARLQIGYALHCKGLYKEAIAHFRKAMDLGEPELYAGILAISLARKGQADEAMKLLEDPAVASARSNISNYTMAVIKIAGGSAEEAFPLLEREITSRTARCSYFAVAPELDDIRTDPRFIEMLQHLNLPKSLI